MGTKDTIIVVFALFLFGCGGATGVTGEPGAPAAKADQLTRASHAVTTLQSWYDQSTGLYQTTGWWNSANAITVLVDYARVSRSSRYDSVFVKTFAAAQKENLKFLNKFYDDEGWWALAWIECLRFDRKQAVPVDGQDDFCRHGGWVGLDLRRRHLVEQRSRLQERHRQ